MLKHSSTTNQANLTITFKAYNHDKNEEKLINLKRIKLHIKTTLHKTFYGSENHNRHCRAGMQSRWLLCDLWSTKAIKCPCEITHTRTHTNRRPGFSQVLCVCVCVCVCVCKDQVWKNWLVPLPAGNPGPTVHTCIIQLPGAMQPATEPV